MRRVVILAHRHDKFMGGPYYLREVARLLGSEGVEIVLARGPRPHVDADVACLHVDMTVVPDDHLQFLSGYERVLNGRLHDISKRRVSRNLLSRDDAYDGPVLLKANRNCGGHTEAVLAERGFLPGTHKYIPDYRVLNSPAEVEEIIWNDPDYVVERFLPEMEEGAYKLRMWKFLGNAETNTIAYSREPIAKGKNVFRRVEEGTVPDELRHLREELGADFGKIDYAIVDGRPVLYDLNRTPTISRPMTEEMPRIVAFAKGLRDFALRR